VILAIWFALFTGIADAQPDPVRILVITGGHDYHHESFNQMWTSLGSGFSHSIVELPDAYDRFRVEQRDGYDVLVFYHMWQTINPDQQAWLSGCIRDGKPLVVLHHSICAFDDWPEYIRIIGGKYFHSPTVVEGITYPASSYEHDRRIAISAVDSLHPVTLGISDFELFDETYKGFYVSPRVKPLLKTQDPTSTPVIGWTHRYGKARVVTLQSGHDTPTFQDDNFRRLVKQAILYVYHGNPHEG
jgi:hypothetical protein